MTITHSFHLLDPMDERWLVFLASRPESNIFQHPSWIYNLAECYGYKPFIVVVLNDQGTVLAGLPIMEVNSFLTGHRWVSLPFTDHCAPLYRDSETLNLLTRWLVEFFNSEGLDKIELRWELPPSPYIYPYSDYVLHTVQLDSDAENLYKRLKKTKRQDIRKSINKGVRVERGTTQEYLRKYYHHQLYVRRKHGIPTQPWKFFELLGKNILEKELGFVLLAYKGDECIAGIVILQWQQTLTYKFSASDQTKLDLHPNHLLLWTAIQWGCAHGFTSFDLGRSNITDAGLRDFKSSWAAEEKPLIYSTICTNPPEFASSKLLPVMNIIIRNSPIWVNRLIGELLYKHVG